MAAADDQIEPAHGSAIDQVEAPRAWEEIEEGRYQPRRIRGSCLGRVLG
jgi:hypothetical protein